MNQQLLRKKIIRNFKKLYVKKKYIAAHNFLENVVDKFVCFDVVLNYRLGLVYSELGLVDKAMESYKKCMISDEQVEEKAFACHNLGVKYFEMGRFVEARDSFLVATQVTNIHPLIYFNLARTYIQLGQHQEAEHIIERIYRSSLPRDYDSWYIEAGKYFYDRDEFIEAIKQWKKYIKFNQDDGEIWLALGHAYSALEYEEIANVYYAKAKELNFEK